MKPARLIGFVVLIVVALIVVNASVYVVFETEQVVLTQFGKPVGDPNQLPTKDKRFISIDTYARWQITDPLLFFQRLRDEPRAQSRLDDILDGETRNTIAKHQLIEVVRTSNREFTLTEELGGDQDLQEVGKIEFGRDALAEEVLQAAKGRVGDLGIEILDFRFKRLNYVPEVQREVDARMISERQRIAEQFRSEGAGESARINGERERDLKRIRSEAYRQAQEIKGRADAEAADIYAGAYKGDPEFYRFLKTMDAFKHAIDKETILLLSTDGEFLRYLEKSK
jgi:membrane protease subunit HflC